MFWPPGAPALLCSWRRGGVHVAPATSFVRVEFKVGGADLRVLSLPLRFRHAGSDLNQDQLVADKGQPALHFYTTRLFWAVCVEMKRYGCSQKAGGEIRPKGLFSPTAAPDGPSTGRRCSQCADSFHTFRWKNGIFGMTVSG